MALFEFGAAKRRKACLKRIETALKLAQRELHNIRYHQGLIMRLIGGYDGDGEDQEWLTNAFSRAGSYLAIASENVVVGLDKSPWPPFRRLVPPLDPRDRAIGNFIQEFRRFHYGPAPRAQETDDASDESPTRAGGVLVLNGERELLGTMPARPVGAYLDDYEGYTFIPTAGPLDADQREWLTHAIWGAGVNLPTDHLPDDATLLSHAKFAATKLDRSAGGAGRVPASLSRSVHVNERTRQLDAAES
ncbi:hypothetical protein ACFOMD_01405 [Sphingoaurantiacus capsulatus]|uniref:Uncharacterized protein n=1 Tax=Sphingoaurantiacus capsulatus TaxID=1771310 RepID=A0ABV7X7P5_9SPHN